MFYILIIIIPNCHITHKVHVPELLSPDGTTRFPDEAEFKSLEETRPTTVEMAQEEDEKEKESSAAEKEMSLYASIPLQWWGHGVVRDPRGLQL